MGIGNDNITYSGNRLLACSICMNFLPNTRFYYAKYLPNKMHSMAMRKLLIGELLIGGSTVLYSNKYSNSVVFECNICKF